MNTAEANLFYAIRDNNDILPSLSSIKDINFRLMPDSKLAEDLKAFCFQTPLYLATKLGNVDAIKKLLAYGASTDIISSDLANGGMFASAHNYVVMSGSEELIALFDENAVVKGISGVSTKKRSANAKLMDMTDGKKKKRGRKPAEMQVL